MKKLLLLAPLFLIACDPYPNSKADIGHPIIDETVPLVERSESYIPMPSTPHVYEPIPVAPIAQVEYPGTTPINEVIPANVD